MFSIKSFRKTNRKALLKFILFSFLTKSAFSKNQYKHHGLYNRATKNTVPPTSIKLNTFIEGNLASSISTITFYNLNDSPIDAVFKFPSTPDTTVFKIVARFSFKKPMMKESYKKIIVALYMKKTFVNQLKLSRF